MSDDRAPISRLIDLSGKVAIVTGAGQGLGRACALRLAELGASVVANDLDPANAKGTADEIARRGGTATSVGGDVSSRDDATAMVAAAVDAFGRVDILVNNAGIWPRAPFLESDGSVWRATLEVNVLGVLTCSQAVANRLIAQGEGGAIVNVASIAAQVPHPDWLIAYGASKAAVVNLTRSLAKHLAPNGIRVNAVLPGGMETPGVQDNPERRQGADIPLGWRADPDDVALGVAFMATGLARYVTGTDLIVDGGATLL